jgi:hypothetical protein
MNTTSPNVVPCFNHDICGAEWNESEFGPVVLRGGGKFICANCDMMNWGQLEYTDTNDECCVCFDTKTRQVKLRCGHWLCVECCRVLLYPDMTEFHMDPMSFGCPPCPHYKNNMTLPSCESCTVRPCCEEDDIVMDRWALQNPDRSEAWNTLEQMSLDQGAEMKRPKCPLCRYEI